MLSVVIPTYNEEAMVPRTAAVIADVLDAASIPFEMVFVDDGSRDGSWDRIQDASAASSRVRGVRFSRNFGKESAILAGLSSARGDCCVVIDCDLQHPPAKIVEMYRLWQDGYEIVEGQKASRGSEGALHSLAARIFYAVISKATGFDMAHASDFKLLDRKAVTVLVNMRERCAFFRALSSWVGFKTAAIEFDVAEREAGESKWSTLSLVKYAVNNITSFSTAPMQLVTVLGVIMLVISVVFGFISLAQKIAGQALEGFTTVILLQLFSSSIVMISLGIIGYYIAKIYEEVKSRPRYIIAEACGTDADGQSDQEALR